MRRYRSKVLAEILQKWPGNKYFGVYRYLPIFFCFGAVLEFSMINWKVGEVNFYKTFKKRRARELAEFALEADKIKPQS